MIGVPVGDLHAGALVSEDPGHDFHGIGLLPLRRET